MKYLTVAVLLFATQAQALTLEELVGICGPDPANYSVTVPGSEFLCEMAQLDYDQIQAGVPPAPAPASCGLGTFLSDATTTYYPDGKHIWLRYGEVLLLDKALIYSTTLSDIRVKDQSGITHIIADGFTPSAQPDAQTCLNDLIKARRL